MKALKRTLGRKWSLQSGEVKSKVIKGTASVAILLTLLGGCGNKEEVKEEASQLTPPAPVEDVIPEEPPVPEEVDEHSFLSDDLNAINLDLVSEADDRAYYDEYGNYLGDTTYGYDGGSGYTGGWSDGWTDGGGTNYIDEVVTDEWTPDEYVAENGGYVDPEGNVWDSEESYQQWIQSIGDNVDTPDDDLGTGDDEVVVTPEPEVTPAPDEQIPEQPDLPQDENGDYYETEQDVQDWEDAEQQDNTPDDYYLSPYDGSLWVTKEEHDAWYAEHPELITTNDAVVEEPEATPEADNNQTEVPEVQPQQPEEPSVEEEPSYYVVPSGLKYEGQIFETEQDYLDLIEYENSLAQEAEAQAEVTAQSVDAPVEEEVSVEEAAPVEEEVIAEPEVANEEVQSEPVVIEEEYSEPEVILPSAGEVVVTADSVTTSSDSISATIEEAAPVETYSEPAPVVEAPAEPVYVEPAPAPVVEAPAPVYVEPAPAPEPPAETYEEPVIEDSADMGFQKTL